MPSSTLRPALQPSSRPTPLTELASSLDSLLSWVRRHAPSAGYSMTARATMARLQSEGSARISDLARLEGVTQPAMTGLVNRLESEGLMRRDPDPRDARAALVVLTPAGDHLIRERRGERSRLIAEQIERLPEADQEALMKALPALQRLGALH